MDNHWFVYMLRCSDRSFYIGISNDLTTRIQKHNDGVGAKYTRSRRPVVLIWSEAASSESAARKREAQLKQYSRSQKEKLLTIK